MVRAALICHDDTYYLPAALKSLDDVPATIFINKRPWHGPVGNWKAAEKLAKKLKVEVVLGEWEDESAQRRATLEWARAQKVRRLLIPDTDEILDPVLLTSLLELAEMGFGDQIHVEMDTYWKSPEYVIRPRERLRPIMMVDPNTVEHVFIRDYRGTKPLVLPEPHGVMHHLSYVEGSPGPRSARNPDLRSDGGSPGPRSARNPDLRQEGGKSRIERKLESWSHRDEVVQGWWDEVWRRWNDERGMRNIHPTHPEAYGFAERIRVPEILIPAWEAYLQANGGVDPLHPLGAWAEHGLEGRASRVSVVIPLYGGPEDIYACLESLQECQDLVQEVVVVDDKSPDDAPDVVARFPFARLVSNPVNMGFAATCNRGMAETTGEVAILLNSDTRVSRAGLYRLVESLMSSGPIAAAGPFSNRVGHFQRRDVTYTDPRNQGLFADDFARRPAEDIDIDMLVGFCLAIKRKAWEDVGPFDTGFGLGMFEDNDLCYRLRRAGYRLVLSTRSFIHHEGNHSLDRSPEDKFAVFARNEDYYVQKWRKDLELGFVSHLPGRASPEPIQFNEARRPEKVERELATLVKQANITLCMIVKNEERVLADCLKSAQPFFTQIIVIDTGSTDRTIEIAKAHGAEVHKFKWVDSFAAARNESMKHAKGPWIFWMDADDTLPWTSGENLVRAAVNAPPQVGGFIVPVRFVNDDPMHGTMVDHVKLFRNYPGLAWFHRIHEQILGSLREHGAEIGRLPAEVWHSGYDTSEEGQQRKRERDERLLMLDLQDNPNHPFTLFNVGMTAHYCKNHERALEFLNKSIANCRADESILRKAYALLAGSLREMGRADEAVETVDKGLAACPGDPELLFHRGVLLGSLGRPIEALAAYRQVLGQDISGHYSSIDTGILGYKTHYNMAGILLDLGNYADGQKHLREAVGQRPGDLALVFDLFNAAVRFGDMRTAGECLGIVERTEGRSANWLAMRERLG